jgi:hypothetical protein
MSWMIGAIVLFVVGDVAIGLKLMASRRRIAELQKQLRDVEYRRGMLYSEVWRLQVREERLNEINYHAWRMEEQLRQRLAESDFAIAELPSSDDCEDDPDYFDYLESLGADRDAEVRGRCTCNEAFEAMHDLEPSCELHS